MVILIAIEGPNLAPEQPLQLTQSLAQSQGNSSILHKTTCPLFCTSAQASWPQYLKQYHTGPRHDAIGCSPTKGAAHAATPPSKERSKAYTVLRSSSGTISANMALLLDPHLAI